MDNATVRKHKSALTRAKKVSPHKVVEVCTIALEDFEDNGFPDCWSLWERAKYDAEMEIKRNNWVMPRYLRGFF